MTRTPHYKHHDFDLCASSSWENSGQENKAHLFFIQELFHLFAAKKNNLNSKTCWMCQNVDKKHYIPRCRGLRQETIPLAGLQCNPDQNSRNLRRWSQRPRLMVKKSLQTIFETITIPPPFQSRHRDQLGGKHTTEVTGGAGRDKRWKSQRLPCISRNSYLRACRSKKLWKYIWLNSGEPIRFEPHGRLWVFYQKENHPNFENQGGYPRQTLGAYYPSFKVFCKLTTTLRGYRRGEVVQSHSSHDFLHLLLSSPRHSCDFLLNAF